MNRSWAFWERDLTVSLESKRPLGEFGFISRCEQSGMDMDDDFTVIRWVSEGC